jgi:hypothetical protein
MPATEAGRTWRPRRPRWSYQLLRVEEVALRRAGEVLTGRIVVTGKEAKARWFVEKARTLPFFVSADIGA